MLPGPAKTILGDATQSFRGSIMVNRILVWDRFVRLFHWTLVAAFSVAYLTGDEETPLHFYAGYLVGALLVARIGWGFIGSRHARFADFVTGPAPVLDYLRSLVRGPTRHFVGHNPAGGWMVLLLLGSLILTVTSGLRAYGLEGHGPLAVERLPRPDPATMDLSAYEARRAARRERHRKEEFWEDVHESAANGTLALVGLHVFGVVLSSLRHRENLVRAMITGHKALPPEK